MTSGTFDTEDPGVHPSLAYDFCRPVGSIGKRPPLSGFWHENLEKGDWGPWTFPKVMGKSVADANGDWLTWVRPAKYLRGSREVTTELRVGISSPREVIAGFEATIRRSPVSSLDPREGAARSIEGIAEPMESSVEPMESSPESIASLTRPRASSVEPVESFRESIASSTDPIASITSREMGNWSLAGSRSHAEPGDGPARGVSHHAVLHLGHMRGLGSSSRS